METLAGIYLSIVLAINSIVPQANVPQVLGIEATSSSQVRKNVEMIEKKRELKDSVKEKREEILEEIKNRREELKTKIEDKREELKERLSELKDQRKARVVENIDDSLSKRNEKWINHWADVISRLNESLAKIQTKTTELSTEGKDVTSVNTAIARAQSSIAEAQANINAQASKTYTIEINSENTLGRDVSGVISQFKTDISKVLQSIKSAKTAVKEAFEALRSINNKE